MTIVTMIGQRRILLHMAELNLVTKLSISSLVMITMETTRRQKTFGLHCGAMDCLVCAQFGQLQFWRFFWRSSSHELCNDYAFKVLIYSTVTSQCVALCQWTRTYIFCWCWCWAPAQCAPADSVCTPVPLLHLQCCSCEPDVCSALMENRGSVQCTARARSRESIWTKPGQQAAAHPTTPSLSSGFSRENIVPSVARPFTWIRPWGSTMTLCTLNSSAHCTLRKHNSTLHTGDGAQVLLSCGQSGSRRLCHSGSISS